MRLSDYESDPAKMANGVWWSYPGNCTVPGNVPHAKDGCFLIVPMIGNEAFANAFTAAQTPHLGTLRDKETPEEVAAALRKAIWAKAMSKAVLRGWANWDDLPPYTEEKATELLIDPRWVLISEFVVRAANENRAALLREEEQAKGN